MAGTARWRMRSAPRRTSSARRLARPYSTLFASAARPTLAVTVLGLGVGLMTYGFQLWVPTNLQHLGYSA